ncbi:radical SAM protein [bacterium]|nr:radical SAM protein [bacterium]
MATAFRPPNRALWEITWRCDLRCDHCLVHGGGAKDGELSTGEALDLADQLARLGVRAVSLTGGEPLMRRDWPAIAERVRARGMALRFALNGHLLDETAIATLVDLGTESLSVSVDGVKSTHDRIRHGPRGPNGASSFDRVMDAIDRLAATPIVVTARTSISNDNIDDLPALYTLLRGRVKKWVIQIAHRTGRIASDHAHFTPLSVEHLPRVADFIVRHARDPVLQPRAFNSIGYLSRHEPILRQAGRDAKNPIWRGCQCGIVSIGIEPDGGIKGCANQVGDPFIVGNVRDEALDAIWNDRPRWHWLNPTPDKMTGNCSGCALAQSCSAGCSVLAYRTTGEMFNNPYCLRKMENDERARTTGAAP